MNIIIACCFLNIINTNYGALIGCKYFFIRIRCFIHILQFFLFLRNKFNFIFFYIFYFTVVLFRTKPVWRPRLNGEYALAAGVVAGGRGEA